MKTHNLNPKSLHIISNTLPSEHCALHQQQNANQKKKQKHT